MHSYFFLLNLIIFLNTNPNLFGIDKITILITRLVEDSAEATGVFHFFNLQLFFAEVTMDVCTRVWHNALVG